MSRRRHQRGITLIEVMIALAVLSMIVVSVWSGFRGTMSGMQATEEIQNRYAIVRNGLTRMQSELMMTYLSHNRPLDDVRQYTLLDGVDNSSRDDLTFSTFAHLRMRKDANESDQCVLQYFIEKDPQDPQRTHLFRRESRRLTGDKADQLDEYFPAYVMIEDVEEFDVKYWDDRQREWLDEWRTTRNDMQPDRLPTRIKMKLVVKDGSDRVTFTAQAALPMQEKIDLGKD
ncbi:MAG: prepilin-type N-terminal cleavage/methylation domain-containing protein [Deltaproteobacteria bacterium]|nr:prepilin-type N-terminal cleavage/methylation domain-containing protein [Deltaproteobacteria bacterium]MBK8719196.1 prepilin-type N-terminal cleavage/methylation domain-containing protein [Deltaproteobacteria bacterium]MBP7290867.1 prepilin-type N-terminal cleavage/methylation domain-containing protein [Nannocystaceae bacterium]